MKLAVLTVYSRDTGSLDEYPAVRWMIVGSNELHIIAFNHKEIVDIAQINDLQINCDTITIDTPHKSLFLTHMQDPVSAGTRQFIECIRSIKSGNSSSNFLKSELVGTKEWDWLESDEKTLKSDLTYQPVITNSSPFLHDLKVLGVAAEQAGLELSQKIKSKLDKISSRHLSLNAESASNVDNPGELYEAKTAESILNEIDQMIGLCGVKSEVRNLVNRVKIDSQRKDFGMPISGNSNHMVFTGNPGTGKTTVARKIACIFKLLKIIRTDKMIEADRSMLVAEYMGQTAIKTLKVLEKAKGGVLFIDEAYSLSPKSSQDYSHEAISTILKFMEDHRDDLVIILAGYPNDMTEFLESNAGFKSRINKFIHFEDYSELEMTDILVSMLQKDGYKLGSDVQNEIRNLMSRVLEHKDLHFGNARECRNIKEKILTNQANRLSRQAQLMKEDLELIVKEDLSLY